MIYRFKKIDSKVLLNKGDFSIDNCDILINWISPEIKDGPNCYKILAEKAGDQFIDNLLTYRGYIKAADTFTTHAGLLPATIIINCVIPYNKAMYNDCFYRIKETIKSYYSDGKRLSRFITLTIPDNNYKEFIFYFETYFKELNFVQEFRIIIDSEKKFNSLKEQLNIVFKTYSKFNLKFLLTNLKKTFKNALTRN